jgi:hypothetical protein
MGAVSRFKGGIAPSHMGAQARMDTGNVHTTSRMLLRVVVSPEVIEESRGAFVDRSSGFQGAEECAKKGVAIPCGAKKFGVNAAKLQAFTRPFTCRNVK